MKITGCNPIQYNNSLRRNTDTKVKYNSTPDIEPDSFVKSTQTQKMNDQNVAFGCSVPEITVEAFLKKVPIEFRNNARKILNILDIKKVVLIPKKSSIISDIKFPNGVVLKQDLPRNCILANGIYPFKKTDGELFKGTLCSYDGDIVVFDNSSRNPNFVANYASKDLDFLKIGPNYRMEKGKGNSTFSFSFNDVEYAITNNNGISEFSKKGAYSLLPTSISFQENGYKRICNPKEQFDIFKDKTNDGAEIFTKFDIDWKYAITQNSKDGKIKIATKDINDDYFRYNKETIGKDNICLIYNPSTNEIEYKDENILNTMVNKFKIDVNKEIGNFQGYKNNFETMFTDILNDIKTNVRKGMGNDSKYLDLFLEN